MYVLADIEWIENEFGNSYPTQIAAVKVDENWNEVAVFNQLIAPKDSGFHKWDAPGFTGASIYDFLHARDAKDVLCRFERWLSKNDIIIWWHISSDYMLNKFNKTIAGIKNNRKCVVLNKYVYSFINCDAIAYGNAYLISQNKGLNVDMTLQHSAINDVKTVLLLLKAINFEQDYLLKTIKKTKESDLTATIFPNAYYQCDFSKSLIHKKSCLILDDKSIITHGYNNLLAPISKGYKPCQCCVKEYREALRNRNVDLIKKSGYTYIYTPTSDIYHKYNCSAMYYVNKFRGFRKFDNVLKAGLVPCKICCPTPDDEKQPREVISDYEKNLKERTNNEDRKAIRRQQIAFKERAEKLKDKSLTKEQKQDVLTLTHTSFAFWAVHGYETFHLRSCPKLNNMSNIIGFKYYKDAIKAGFSPCRRCKPSSKNDANVSVPIYNKNRSNEKVEDLASLCNEIGFKYSYDEFYFSIETNMGKWRIDLTSSPIKVEHINLLKSSHTDEYHNQPRIFLSLLDVFDYIKRHDGN